MIDQNEMQKFITKLVAEVQSGLRHGFFDFSLIGEAKNGKRHVLLKAGKSHKFIISPEEIQDEQ